MDTNEEKSYIELYEEYGESLKKGSAAVLNSPRDEAARLFRQTGFPTLKTEEYRHSDFRKMMSVNYGMNLNRVTPTVDYSDLFKCEVPNINSYVFFVVNDTFFLPKEGEKDLEDLHNWGVEIGSLASYSKTHPDLVSKYYHNSCDSTDAFYCLNTMFAQDGLFLYIPKNVVLPRPIQLIYISSTKVPLLSNPRNLIIVEEGAKAQILVCTHAMGELASVSNRVTEVFVGENATYDHYRLENTGEGFGNLNALYLRQMQGSNVLVNEITLQNGTTRNNICINLDGENCETVLCGMAVADRKEHIDNFTVINHNVPRCKSKELFKYVLDGESVGVFKGKIYVKKDAQQTEANQTNRNVCMTNTARIYTEPQLEIYADDVKCSHGATTGMVDDNAMFYLRSRGIPEEEAKMLLMYAFVDDVLENVRIEALKDKIKQMVEKRFRGEMTRCAGCNICGK